MGENVSTDLIVRSQSVRPMNFFVKLSPALRRRPFTRAWLSSTMMTWYLLLLVVTCVAARPHQDFPVAAEEYHYVFRTDGTYSFSYDTGTGKHQSFRLEARDATGRVSGRYGYIDPDGALRITMYQADATGYRANMVIYQKVTFAPSQPLLVGPLPRSVSFKGARMSGMKSSSNPSAPVGPVPFFSSQDGSILVIGPLPKPLQPPRDKDDTVLASEEKLQVESFGVRDVPQGPPPNAIPSSVLETILQDSFHKIFRGSIPAALVNPKEDGSFRISFDDLGNSKLNVGQSISSQDDLVKISQELLQGPEVQLDIAKADPEDNVLPLRELQRNRTQSGPVNVNMSLRPKNNLTNLNKTLEVAVSEVTDSSSRNRSLNSQIDNKLRFTPSIDIVNKNVAITLPIAASPLTKGGTNEVPKSSSQRVSTLPASLNIGTIPPLTYLPAYNIKVPRQSIYVGSLPSY